MKHMATCSVPYSKSKVRGQKHPREVVENRKQHPKHRIQYITSKDCQHPVQDNQCPGRAGHHRPSRPLSADIITCYVRFQWSKYTVIYIYIYTLVQTIISVQAKLEVVRRKHIFHLTGFGAYSSTCCKGTDNCASTMGVDQLPSSTVRL